MAKSNYTFNWVGSDRSGKSRKGKIVAASAIEAKNLLRRQGVSAKSVRKQQKSLFNRPKKIKSADISIFTRQMATMLGAGVSLLQSLEMIASGMANETMRVLILEIASEVKAGGMLSVALRKHPNYFDDLYCDLVKTGEQAGSLEIIYDRIATYKEKSEALKSKIKKAMFYPIGVLVVAFIVTTILLVFVVPQFEEIFAGFGAELPAFTQLVIGISRFLQAYGLYFAVALIVGGYLFGRAYKKSRKLRDSLDVKILKIPVIGEILQKGAIARYARTLSTTFASGVPLIQGLESAAGASGNAVYRDAIMFVRSEVSSGMPMNSAMRTTDVFPDMVSQMVAIGEESGSVDDMLSKVASIYEAQVDDMVDGLTSLLEPMIMAVLGVVIGGLIVAMYLPIFQLGNVV
ncbi:type II secretion system F family protein [Alteromonas sp. 5E99-2]|uniref:type II secretion system F family protein n=1 Tax=Alteromonas sp. 5E99-2 TaxID=2817683 RepID=UPI001A97E227|nr:type II secretion system F family protein [Alteromonas sp. 5E99-2]MBO1256437.1 type II secretion system F family protein [Alteromonas sp. 5E99-2]